MQSCYLLLSRWLDRVAPRLSVIIVAAVKRPAALLTLLSHDPPLVDYLAGVPLLVSMFYRLGRSEPRMPEEGWMDASRELPDEGATVPVYLDCDHVTRGTVIDGGWEFEIAPWELADADGAEVECWRYLPWPPDEPPGAPEREAAVKSPREPGLASSSTLDPAAAKLPPPFPDVHALRVFDAGMLDCTLDELGDRAEAVGTRGDFEDFLAQLLRSTDAGQRRYRGVPVWPLADALPPFSGAWKTSSATAARRTWGRRRVRPGGLIARLLFMELFRGTPEAEALAGQGVISHDVID
jgi:hypothetical protein